VLSTSSLWCPAEHTSRGYLWLSHYGIWGNVRSVYDDTETWWARMYFDNGWWRGTQWTVKPLTTLTNLSAANVNAMTVCAKQDDLGGHP
jgi:hypothetical protein